MAESRITIYSSYSSLINPFKILRDIFRDLTVSRELAWRLAVRDIYTQYRQTFLGVLWAFILPLANAFVWIFLNSTGIVAVADTALPYPVYVFTGTMLWAIFIEALNAPLQQVNAARPLLAKLNFPREALIVSGIYQTLFSATIKTVILLGSLVVLEINPGWGLLFFPCGVFSLIVIGTAVGLLITPVGMLYTDVGRALPLVMQFFMYITPVVFPIPKLGWAAIFYRFNPLTPVIVTARDWLTGITPNLLIEFLLVNLAAIVILLLVLVVYRLAMPILIERMSA